MYGWDPNTIQEYCQLLASHSIVACSHSLFLLKQDNTPHLKGLWHMFSLPGLTNIDMCFVKRLRLHFQHNADKSISGRSKSQVYYTRLSLE